MKDMNVGQSKNAGKSGRSAEKPETASDAEDMENEDYDMQDEDDSDDADYDASNTQPSAHQQDFKNSIPTDEDFSFARYVHKANLG